MSKKIREGKAERKSLSTIGLESAEADKGKAERKFSLHDWLARRKQRDGSKKEKISFIKAMGITKRGYAVWWKANPKILIAPIFCAIADGLSPYIGIYLSAQIINELAGNRSPQILLRLTLTVLISAAVLAFISSCLNRWKNCQQAGMWYLKNKVYSDKLLSMDFHSIEDAKIHDMFSQIKQADNWSGWGLSRLIWSFESVTKAIMSIIGAVALTVSLFLLQVPEGALSFLNHPLFIVLIAVLMLGFTFIAPILSNKSNLYWPKYSADAKMGNRLFNFFSSKMSEPSRALDVRLYRQDKFCLGMLQADMGFGTSSRIAKAARGPMGGLSALSAAVSQIFTGTVYLFICLKALGGAFGIGSVTQYIASITALSGGLSILISIVGDFRNNAAFLQTVFEFLDTPNEMYEGCLTIEKRSDKRYDIEYKNVSFQYPGQETYALRNVTLKFTIGERLAVVGMNGCGKTTFIKLLCRLYDPTEGEILLNGINIKKYNYSEYLSIFSVVFQDFNLLSFSLGQNIASAMAYDTVKTQACLDGAGFAKRLSELEKGLETNLYKDFDEQGVNISGGEAQKIALARALYKDAAFIILDEPTAALDPVAEFEIYSRMNNIVGSKTAVFISHRLSSCRFCQNIAVFHKGQIVQQGSHDQLVADVSGKYYELWTAQAQYYTEKEVV